MNLHIKAFKHMKNRAYLDRKSNQNASKNSENLSKKKNLKGTIFFVFFFLLTTISTYAQISETMSLKSDATMYEKSTAVSKKIAVIEAGKTVKAFEKTNGYYRVDYNGSIGYVNEIFLQKTSSIGKSVNTAIESKAAKLGVKILKSEAKMRESANPISSIIFTLPVGTSVKTLSLDEGYYRVEHNGEVGFINEIYFQANISSNTSSHSTNSNKTTSTNYDGIKYTSASPKPSFEEMLRGVRVAVLFSGNIHTRGGYANYLREMGFESVVIRTIDANDIDSYQQRKDVVFVFPLQAEGNTYPFIFTHAQTGYEWKFSSNFTSRDLSKYNYNLENAAYEIFRRAYGYKKSPYNRSSELRLAKRKTGWTRSLIMNDFRSNGLQPIEGIYENSSGINQAKYNVAVKNMKGTLRLIYLSGANNPSDWDEGEIKATLQPTATPNFYKANWIMADKTEDSDFYISFEQGAMNVIFPDKQRDLYIKMYPTASDNIGIPSNTSSSGTGFAISSSGIIVTNYHVIEGAKNIKVRGIDGNFNKSFSAKILISDKNNDLAIIKIDDYSFSTIGTIPYVIKSNVANAGENIFVLGYPLRATMGDEVKLTNGIISSRTGFKGDVTSYQISAPVQPGNSGGPLFDSQGNIIGVINAKHAGAENASYGIKASYLLNMIDLLDSKPTLQKTSVLNSKSLSQQVESIKKFVYIIEVN